MENQTPPFDVEKHFRIFRIFMGIVFLMTLTFQAIELPDVMGHYIAAQVDVGSARVKPILDKIDGTVANVDATSKTIQGFVAEVSHDYYDPEHVDQGFYWDFRNVLDRSSESSFATARLVARLDAQLNGGKDPMTGADVAGVIPAATDLLQQFKKVAESVDGAIGPLKISLEHIAGLTAELEAEMAKGGNLDEIFAKLVVSVDNFNKLVEDDSIKQILVNSASTTKSFAGSAETLDIVMRPWRKKAGQLKVILSKLAGMLKIVVPVPF